jgi:chromosome segregation ATPase
MLDTLINFVISEPELVAYATAAGLFCIWLGWTFKGMGAGRREASLKQATLEAKRSIPQFETSVRSREQKIDRLNLELSTVQERVGELDRTCAQKDAEIQSQAREIRVLTTELSSAKKLQDSGTLLLNGTDFDDDATGDLDPEMQARVNLAETLYEKLRETLAEREERITELETQLTAKQDKPYPLGTTQEDSAPDTVQLLEDRIAAREETIERLETQLSELRQDREMLSELARSRSKSNQSLQDAEAELQSRVPGLEKALEQLGKIVSERETSIRGLHRELEEANKDKKQQQEEILNCIADAKAQEQAREALESRVVSLTSELETQQRSIRDMQYSLEQSESWLDKFKVSSAKRSEELAAVTAERDALAQKLAQKLASTHTN